MSFIAYHGATSSVHQKKFSDLSSSGYRMISLSVNGDQNDEKYTAVWVKRAGPAFLASHGINAQKYQELFDKWTSKGFVPTIITATGSVSNAVFATVFEKDASTFWKARHGMTEKTFNSENTDAVKNNLILKSFTVYGSSSDRRFAAIWHNNPNYVKSHLYPLRNSADYQTAFNAETQLNIYRPALVVVSDDGYFGANYTDNSVGSMVTRHGMTAYQYQKEFKKLTDQGLMPICVDAGGSGTSTRYSAIFAQTDIPVPRNWSINGKGDDVLSELDKLVKKFMVDNAVRAMQLSVRKNGISAYNKAFNWSEPAYRKATASTKFLLASCSKMFVCAAIQDLYNKKLLSPDDRAYNLLGFSNPMDSRSDEITIQQLLDHSSGYLHSDHDWTYDMRNIGLKLNPQKMVTKLDFASYVYKNTMLKYNPGQLPEGSHNEYYNYNYLLASLIVENISGTDFFNYLNTNVLKPANITEVKVWPTVSIQRSADEVLHEDQGLGFSSVNIFSKELTPAIYGGDGMIKEVAAGACGLAGSANAMTQFISTHAVWGNGGRVPSFGNTKSNPVARAGSTPGTTTFAESRGDGIDWAYTINTRDFKFEIKQNGVDELNELRKNIDAVLNKHSSSIGHLKLQRRSKVILS